MKQSKQEKVLSPEDAHFEVIEVSPKLAEEWLKSNDDGQRVLRRTVVDSYAEEMRAGNWKLLPQMIVFNEEGKLVDGQHRLHAVVKAAVTVKLWVASAPGVRVSDSLDRGLQRRISDLLGWSTGMAATAGILYRLQTMSFDNHRMTKDETLHAYESCKEDFDALYSKSGGRSCLSSPAYAALIFARPIDPEEVHSFRDRVQSGAGLKLGDPALTFRNWMLAESRISKRASEFMNVSFAALTAVNHSIKGSSLTKMHFGPTGYRNIVYKRRGMGLVAPSVEQLPSETPGSQLFPKRLAGKRFT